MSWKNPAAVRRRHRLKARIRRAQCRADGVCVQCRAPIQTRGICDACKAYRRKRYALVTKPELAIGATPCRDCGRLPKRAGSIRCQRCQCRRASRLRWTKGQAA